MVDEAIRDQIAQYLTGAQSAIICLPLDATVDQIAAAIALAGSLHESGREAVLAAPDVLNPGIEIPGLEQFQTQLGNRDLTVSFPYQPEAVDKVSYHIDDENQRFSLVIKPQKGAKPLVSGQVTFSYTGAEADLIFLIGVNSLEDLHHLYHGYETLYQTAPIISFNTFETEAGNVKITTADASCMSETMAQLLQSMGMPINADAATNLVTVIEQQTDGFQSLRATADTFATIAELLRVGGRRTRRSKTTQLQMTPPKQMQPLKKEKILKNNSKPAKKKATDSVPQPGDLNYQPSGLTGSASRT